MKKRAKIEKIANIGKKRGVYALIHTYWEEKQTIKQIKCVHADAKKFVVHNVLTPGKVYDVKNETDEFYFIIDNSNRIGGFKKEYFSENIS